MVDKAFVGFVGMLLTSKMFACSSELGRDKYKEELFEKLPFFKDLVRDQQRSVNGSVFYNIVVNNNFFWIPENVHRRMEFHEDVKKVLNFETGDPAYDAIKNRINNGDAYGIVKPVKRAQKEPFSETEFQKACARFFLSPNDTASLRIDGYYKLIYCHKNGKSRDEFYGWYYCEKMVGESINFAEYKIVDGTIYGDVSELLEVYETSEYDSCVSNMKKALSEYRENINSFKEGLLKSIGNHWKNGEEKAALNDYKILMGIYEHREGDSEEHKKLLQKVFTTENAVLPADFLAYVSEVF